MKQPTAFAADCFHELTPLRFALGMAWRETRGAWRRFVTFVLCVALGVAALASVGSLAAGLDATLGREAKALLGGDVEARSARALDREVVQELDRLRAAGARVTEIRELVGMARDPRSGRSVLVELKAPGAAYPLYGTLATAPAGALDRLLEGGGIVVGEELLARLTVRIGDRIELGRAELVIRGVVTREPDRPSTLVGLGPRVFLAPADLDRARLVQRGSRVRHRALVALPPGIAARAARDSLQAAAPAPAVRVVTFDEAQPGMRRFFAQVTRYLGLVGLTSLLVGGVGVASSVTTFLKRRVASLAILKTIGADSRVLLLAYLVQTQVLALAGSVAGLGLGLAVVPLLLPVLRGVFPVEIDWRPEPWALARAALMGMGTALLCALPPLLRIRAVRPSLLLRSEVEPALPRTRRWWLAALPVAIGLAGLALWQAWSVSVGLIFAGATAAALGALALLARALALAAAVRPTHLRGLAWRHGVANLRRPGRQSAVALVALGVAAMLLTTVVLLERGLTREIDHERRREAPSFFFIDVQPDQAARFASVVRDAGGTAPAMTSVVRARLAAVDGVPVTREMVEQRVGRDRSWYFTREYVLTAAADRPGQNRLVRGRWWTPSDTAARPRVSVEEEAAKVLRVDVGSRLTFDVQGVPVEAEVMSVRRVDWQSLSMNFFMILSPGVLDGAPATWVGTARVPVARETRVQDAVVGAFPNVTAIAVRDVLERVASVLDRIADAVRLVAVFSVATGLVVMVGALAASRSERLYESVVLRALGASRGTVAGAFAVEYGCLGAAAGIGGALLASVLAAVVLRFVLDLPWTFEPLTVAASAAVTTVVAVAVGFLGTYRLLGVRPLAILRER
ncbi:MAG: ABC transporter permease [Candidatus Rokubacteria bacterium]|nr:ABC transporter permease [Candidatus Rokubacteria bacterium]